MTEEGRETLALDSVLTDPAALDALKREVKPWLDLLVRSGEVPVSDFPPRCRGPSTGAPPRGPASTAANSRPWPGT